MQCSTQRFTHPTPLRLILAPLRRAPLLIRRRAVTSTHALLLRGVRAPVRGAQLPLLPSARGGQDALHPRPDGREPSREAYRFVLELRVSQRVEVAVRGRQVVHRRGVDVDKSRGELASRMENCQF